MQRDPHDDPVYLGFASPIDVDNLYRLGSHYLPLGKIGGKPSWLNTKNIPTSAQLECKVCKKAMALLIQVYATKDDDPPHSFHRTLFVFICRNPQCSKNNEASNIAVFRCILPRDNPFYSFDGPMDPDLDGDVPNPRLPPDSPHLCEVCGCYASKKCGKCGSSWYCCRDHQALDWSAGDHRAACGVETTKKFSMNPQNTFLFKEMGIELDQEYTPADVFDDLSDAEDEDGVDSDDETDADRKRRLQEFQTFMEKEKKNSDLTTDDLDAATAEQKKDSEYDKFCRLVNLNPDQIIRYQRCGNPLPATSLAPALPEGPDVPPCDICGGPRRFELQLMPHLLSYLDVDTVGHSIDWASIYIFTCASSCVIPNMGYAQEFVIKRDFA